MSLSVSLDSLAQPVAATQTLPQTLLLTTDNVQLLVSGNDYATVQWTVSTVGSGAITAEYSTDAGPTPTNWLTPPQSVLTSTVSANPSTAAWVNATPVAGTYETPIPANCTFFRIRYQTAGTATVVALKGGKRYATGPAGTVKATLFDTTSAVNTAIDTLVLDVSGWAGFSVTYVTPAGGSGAVNAVDDTGASTSQVTVPASATSTGVFGSAGGTGTAFPAAGFASFAWSSRRTRATSAAVAALTSRVRIEAWR